MEFVANITDKRTKTSSVSHESDIRVSQPSVVQLNVHRADVKSMQRVGHDLVITLVNGKVLTIHDFFLVMDGLQTTSF